ncbi:glycosyltransferase family 2 protein [Neokomagataea anthophila]|uniref:Glycosyltransferase family 2 protein n=1 Tax=Neokomagataea anthophila TaxID=2826925 RepID=A0ABS5E8H9_9PROT|nr:glycosyltransferase family 2 protein [Neokomagataea anthophila]MBR0559808.1 glycosyltransferase family 2 protein [Neokomagataea anthophila]
MQVYSPPRVAVVTIVCNEITDFLSWLGWHIRLGVQTFVIFDDGSSDGTEKIIADAACSHDIRLYKIEGGSGNHINRQKDTYLYALKELRKTHNWVGFLDADEFLYLDNDLSIIEYLDKISQNIGAVGFHWCNYGSSGHVLKPSTSILNAFDHHSRSDEMINRHIKTFLRIDSWSGEWENVHYFPLRRGKYVDASGKDIEWSNLKGVTSQPANWQGGRILHYQIRSMEHYVERAKRRKDIELKSYNFYQSDWNDLYNQEPKKYLFDVNMWHYNTINQSYARALNILINNTHKVNNKEINNTNFNILEVKNLNSSDIFDKIDEKIFVLYSGDILGDCIYLFCSDKYSNIKPINTHDLCTTFIPCNVVFIENKNEFYLQGIINKKYLQMSPKNKLSFINHNELAEESVFFFEDYSKTSVNISIFILLQDALSEKITLETLIRLSCRDFKNTILLLPLLLPNLPLSDRQEFEGILGFKIH